MSDTITLDVGAMTCEGCASRVRDALQAVSGVASADVSHEQGTAVISHDGASRENLSGAVRTIGYTVDGLGEDFHWRDGSVMPNLPVFLKVLIIFIEKNFHPPKCILFID